MFFVLYCRISDAMAHDNFSYPFEEYAHSILDSPLSTLDSPVENPYPVKLNYHILLSSTGNGTQNILTLTGGQFPNNDPNLTGGQFPNNGHNLTGGEGSRPSLFKPN